LLDVLLRLLPLRTSSAAHSLVCIVLVRRPRPPHAAYWFTPRAWTAPPGRHRTRWTLFVFFRSRTPRLRTVRTHGTHSADCTVCRRTLHSAFLELDCTRAHFQRCLCVLRSGTFSRHPPSLHTRHATHRFVFLHQFGSSQRSFAPRPSSGLCARTSARMHRPWTIKLPRAFHAPYCCLRADTPHQDAPVRADLDTNCQFTASPYFPHTFAQHSSFHISVHASCGRVLPLLRLRLLRCLSLDTFTSFSLAFHIGLDSIAGLPPRYSLCAHL